MYYLILAVQVLLTLQHGAMISPAPRNLAGTDWNSGNVGAQHKGWVDAAGNPTIEPCGDAKWIMPGAVKEVLREGSCFDIEVAISAQHAGYYEFRLCNASVSDKKQLTLCLLNGPVLRRANPLDAGRATYKINTPPQWTQEHLATRWRQEPEDGVLTGTSFKGYQVRKLKYCLPAGFSCDKCILQWYWQTLNSWQTESAATLDTTSGERYWNCADVQIIKSDAPQTATCADGIKNQNEVGVDCGGACKPCENGGCQNEYPLISGNLINYHTQCKNGKSAACCDALNVLISNVKKFCANPDAIGLPDFVFYANVYGCASPVLPWSLNTSYRIGSRVTFAGSTYECLQAHSSTVGWEPSVALSLWRKIA
jgi:hypothetical protein